MWSIARAVARRAFATAEDRAWLEGLLWPRVGAKIAAWREELETRAAAPRAAVVEVPLLFEAGMDGAFDATVASSPTSSCDPVGQARVATRRLKNGQRGNSLSRKKPCGRPT